MEVAPTGTAGPAAARQTDPPDARPTTRPGDTVRQSLESATRTREPKVDTAYAALRTLHVLAFVFMSVPQFNLIRVNERAQLGSAFNYDADRYLENIIRRRATRCFAFQATVLPMGLAMRLVGPLGIGALGETGYWGCKATAATTLC